MVRVPVDVVVAMLLLLLLLLLLGAREVFPFSVSVAGAVALHRQR